MDLLLAIVSGLITGLGLIVVIGAQNSFVLRLGITGPTRAIAAVVAVCALSDAALIAAGVAGVGVLVQQLPALMVVLRVIGSAFLIGYGLLAARRALRPSVLQAGPLPVEPDATGAPAGAGDPSSSGLVQTVGTPLVRAAVVTALAFTWLNPHVYLDTLVFLGSIANQQGADLRWWWAGGAMAGSCLWFAALGFGARFLRPVFARPSAWRVLDIGIAVVMIGLGLNLAVFG